MIERIERIWKLYKELRMLRKKVKTLESDLEFSNKRFNALYYEKTHQQVSYSTMSFLVPNLYKVEKLISPTDLDRRPRAEYITRQLTDEMKVKLFDDLAEQGFIRKTRDDEIGEVYEIKVVRGN